MSAFEKLVERHRDDVYGLALQMTRSETSAVDIAQTSFLSAYAHLNEFRTEAEFGAWVRRIAAELTLLQPCKAARADEHQLHSRVLDGRRGPAQCCPTDLSCGTDEEPLNAELQQAIQRATDLLPEDQRQALVFKDLAALSYEEIADISRHSIPAIKWRVHQARLSLCKAIDRFHSKG